MLLVWLYIAVHGFLAPSGTASSQKRTSRREAAGMLAAEGTPAAVLGGSDDLVTANMSAGTTDSECINISMCYFPMDCRKFGAEEPAHICVRLLVFGVTVNLYPKPANPNSYRKYQGDAKAIRMRDAAAELEVRLNKLGRKGTAPSLASALLQMLGRGNGAAVPAGNPAAAAQMLATSAANMARVTCGPLPRGNTLQPLDALLTGLKACTVFLQNPVQHASMSMLRVVGPCSIYELSKLTGCPFISLPLNATEAV